MQKLPTFFLGKKTIFSSSRKTEYVGLWSALFITLTEPEDTAGVWTGGTQTGTVLLMSLLLSPFEAADDVAWVIVFRADISLTSPEEFELSVLEGQVILDTRYKSQLFAYLFFLFSAALALTLSFLLTRSCLYLVIPLPAIIRWWR